MLIPLKQKYLVQKGGFKCGSYKNRTGNSHGPKKHSILWYLNRRAKKMGGKK